MNDQEKFKNILRVAIEEDSLVCVEEFLDMTREVRRTIGYVISLKKNAVYIVVPRDNSNGENMSDLCRIELSGISDVSKLY